MNMRIHYYYIYIAALLLLASCSDTVVEDAQTAARDAMELRAEICQQYTTRANDGGFADGDQIGVYIVNYKDEAPQPLQPSGNHADNVCFTYDEASGKWTGSYQIYWKDKKTPIDAYGYYPFDAELSSTSAYPFSVQQNQRDNLKTGRHLLGYEASDFLWAKKEGVTPTAGAITLQHQHLMAGIKVILTEGFGFDEGEWNEVHKSVLVKNTITDCTINLQTGIVTPANAETKSITSLQYGGGREGTTFRAVVVPQTIAAKTNLLAITVGGKTYQFKRKEPMVYYPGKLHQFTIEVRKSLDTGDYQFNLISESVTVWDNDPVSHDGSTREYITVHVVEGEYLGDVITRMGLDPKEIINLKLTGTIVGNRAFTYMKEQMPYLEALNMKELRTKNITTRRWESGWGELPYGLPIEADDWLPSMYGMYYLSYVTWPDSIKGVCSFSSCNLRGSLIFPEGLEYIDGDFGGTSGFYDSQTPALSGELYIPSTVKYIANNAFSGTALSGEVVLPEHMTYLGAGAFSGCEFLTGNIHIPNGLTEVYGTFAPNMTAKVVRIPQGVKKVYGIGGQYSSIVFPEGVEYIADCGSSSLTQDVHLPSTLKRLQGNEIGAHWGAFQGSNFAHINLPEGLEFIEESTFEGCNLQDTITLPSTIIQIQERAFASCTKLEAVVLPRHLEEIKANAFENCRSLYYVRCLNPVPPVLSSWAFNGVEKNECALVVPEGSVNAYRNAPGWREFKRISTYQNFVCRPMQAKLLNKSNTRTVVLNSNGSWKVTHCPDWIHPSVKAGYKKKEFTVRIDEMPHGSSDRRDSIVFTLTDKTDEQGNPITCYYTVQQFDYEYDEDTQMTLQQATKGNNGGINIVFLGDGYDAEDIAKGNFLQDMREGMEYFFAVEPYKTYREYFNVYADMAMSYESGVQSSVDIWRQTKFNTIYGAGGNGRLEVHPNDVMDYVLNQVSGTAVTPSNVNQSLIVCVPNDDAYEGIAVLYGSGAAVAFAPHSRYGYPNDYRGIIQHEAGGHGFGKLGDEYVYHRDNIFTCTCVCCGHAAQVEENKQMGWYSNLSLSGRYKEVEWSHLIFDPRYSDIVDIYEGAYMHGRGIYRSEVNSCMNNNVPYYSTISRQAIVERIMQYSGETFDFETFVANDSRQMGDKFLTRSGGAFGGTAMQGRPPIVIKGSPIDNLKKKGGKR